MVDNGTLNEYQDELNRGCGLNPTPIGDFASAFKSTMLGMKKIYMCIEKDITDYHGILSDKILDRDTIKRFGMTLDDIQNFWEIFGSILLSIRPYVSRNYTNLYKEFNDVIPENMLLDIILERPRHALDYETLFLDENMSELCIKIMDYKRSCYKYEHIKNISNDMLSDEWWAFKELMGSKIHYPIDDGKSYDASLSYLFEIIMCIESDFDVYSDDKESLRILGDKLTIFEFATIVINKTLYLLYNSLCEDMKELYDEIKKMRDESKLFIDDSFKDMRDKASIKEDFGEN